MPSYTFVGTFKSFPSLDKLYPVAIAAKALRVMFLAVATAMSKDATRFHPCGVLWESDGHGVKLTATDGHRLAHVEHDLSGLPKGKVLLSADFVHAAIKDLRYVDQDVQLAIDERVATLSVGTDVIIGAVGEDQFPPWQQVVPPPSKVWFKGAIKPLRDALTKVDRHAQVKIAQGLAGVAIVTPEGLLSYLPPQVKTGPTAGEAWVNPSYLLDALRTFDPKATIRVDVPEDLGAFRVTVANDGLGGDVVVVMSCRPPEGAVKAQDQAVRS